MDLWNEYEGRSIDGLFPLERLIRPEGRSAFFTTTFSGTKTVIRLIESHFDEDQILARWSGVSDLHQPNLLTLTRFGQAMMDETSLVYVVLEPTEADLSQILCERPLTLAETRQVASSLIPALQALHARGFVHEHILPTNVLAVGEVVKLRSDCIREAPEDLEGEALRARDVMDLATLFLQCLTQQRNPAVSPTGPPIPSPFREIVHNGVAGTWSLAQMAVALEVATPKSAEPRASLPQLPEIGPIQELHRKSAVVADPVPAAPLATEHAFPGSESDRIRVPVSRISHASWRWIFLPALAVVILVLAAAFALLHRAATPASAPAATHASAEQVPDPMPVSKPELSAAAGPPVRDKLPPASNSRDEWRVVAFTYMRRDQAAAKANTLARRYPALHPAVFAPAGHGPYLVTLGGPLSRDAALGLKNKLRGAGLPRDLYVQNYSRNPR